MNEHSLALRIIGRLQINPETNHAAWVRAGLTHGLTTTEFAFYNQLLEDWLRHLCDNWSDIDHRFATYKRMVDKDAARGVSLREWEIDYWPHQWAMRDTLAEWVQFNEDRPGPEERAQAALSLLKAVLPLINKSRGSHWFVFSGYETVVLKRLWQRMAETEALYGPRPVQEDSDG